MTTEIRPVESDDGLRYELRIEAPPAIVWRSWTEADRLVRWMGKVATVDLREGGEVRVDYGQGDVVTGTYTAVEPDQRLAFTWGWETPDGRMEAGWVEVELEALDGGVATLLRLHHGGLDAPSRKSHAEGWDHFLPRLVEAVASGA